MLLWEDVYCRSSKPRVNRVPGHFNGNGCMDKLVKSKRLGKCQFSATITEKGINVVSYSQINARSVLFVFKCFKLSSIIIFYF